MFFIIAGLLTTAVILFLISPIWLKGQPTITVASRDAVTDEEQVNLKIEKQTLVTSLSELELDYAQGKFLLEDYNRLKTAYEHRLVRVLEKLDALEKTEEISSEKQELSLTGSREWNWAFSLILGLFVIIGVIAAYQLIYGKIERQQREASEERDQSVQPPINPLEMVARLEKKLKENPNDLQGQMMAGRSYMALQRWEEAEKAWRKAIELDERNEVAQFNLADVLIRTAPTPPNNSRVVYEEALDHLEKALMNIPREPVVLWEKGIALVHLGRYQEADQVWTTAFQNLPPGSKDANFVKQALQDLRAGKVRSF